MRGCVQMNTAVGFRQFTLPRLKLVDTQIDPERGVYPILHECTPVRMDLTHSAWSDIFFLGMDFPEGARVLNVLPLAVDRELFAQTCNQLVMVAH